MYNKYNWRALLFFNLDHQEHYLIDWPGRFYSITVQRTFIPWPPNKLSHLTIAYKYVNSHISRSLYSKGVRVFENKTRTNSL